MIWSVIMLFVQGHPKVLPKTPKALGISAQ